MMKTITVLAYNRPVYLERTLAALQKCRDLHNYEVIISIDDSANQEETLGVAHRFADATCHIAPTQILHQEKRLGVNGHPPVVYDLVFNRYAYYGSDFNVVIEDDVVLSPDALELCDWFCNLSTKDRYACLLLHSFSKTRNDPDLVIEGVRFNAWGWAMTKRAWNDVFAPRWDCKKKDPTGWDWSMEYVIQTQKLKVLTPVLSRTTNIGRDDGAHEIAWRHDEWSKGLMASDGEPVKEFLVHHLPENWRESFAPSDWVLKELL